MKRRDFVKQMGGAASLALIGGTGYTGEIKKGIFSAVCGITRMTKCP